MKRLLTVVALFLSLSPLAAQERTGVDVFMGAELHYRDIFFDKLYEVLVNLTPGVKWRIAGGWQLAGQAIVPVYNDYGERYKKVRLNMAVLSKEWAWNERQFLKASAGLFSNERYGVDLKWMYPVNHWLALDAEVGVTGFCSMAVDWECSKMKRLTAQGGARFYLGKVNTEFRLQGGRYLYGDNGGVVEAMRHFKHCTVSLYAQYSDTWKKSGGFKVIVMLPPYKRRGGKVRVRPASNFRLTYDGQCQAYSMAEYVTDPEENERESDFSRSTLRWGANLMDPDFVDK